jgi:hypothetical protein
MLVTVLEEPVMRMVSALCKLSHIHFHIYFVCNNITIIILRSAIKNCNTAEFSPCNFIQIALFRNRMIVQGFHHQLSVPCKWGIPVHKK